TLKTEGYNIYIAKDGATADYEVVRPGDLALTLGAGDVWKAGRELLERLSARERQAEEAG
ncbi:MAG: hypothetical protein AABZ64_03525, partial [Nitrospinota bacterium]